MHHSKFTNLLCLFLFFVVFFNSTAKDKDYSKWPFGNVQNKKSMIYETPEEIGLYNAATGILLSKKDLSLIGIWGIDQSNCIAKNNMNSPLWLVTIYRHKSKKNLVVLPKSSKKITFTKQKTKAGVKLCIKYFDVGREEAACNLKMNIILNDNAKAIRWDIAAEMNNNNASIWLVEFPRLFVKVDSDKKADTRILTPYRRGVERPYSQYATRLPYPGAAVKFQFMAGYNIKNNDGFYFGVEDSEGYKKDFIQRTYLNKNALLLAVSHYPANRLRQQQGFNMNYQVVTRPYKGNWWEAARIYRKWWIKQKWAAKGPMLTRKDVPSWLKNSVVSLKLSTSKKGRTVESNLKYAEELSKLFSGKPMFGIWYTYQQGYGHWEKHGFIIPPKAGVVSALRKMKQKNIHVLAYLQSIIYDQNYNPKDCQNASKYFSRAITGKAAPYHIKVCMCRYTKWWHKRFNKMGMAALKLGFDGIYLDSFGKGSPECFAADHGHPQGGGNTGIAGQRKMASEFRKVMKAENPESAMAGEAPVEAFVDKLDYYLFAVNSLYGYVPVWRTVLGDYMLGHGRGLAFSKAKNNIIPSLGKLFLEGTIFGRISVYSKCFILEPQYKEYKEFLLKLTDYNQHGLEFLRFGEYLKPLKLNPQPASMIYNEYVKNEEVTIPYVINSVTRSHKNGSLAYVFVNVGKKNYNGFFVVNPALRSTGGLTAVLYRMSRNGKKDKISEITGKTSVKLNLKPSQIAFFIVK